MTTLSGENNILVTEGADYMAKINKIGIFFDNKTESWGYRIKMRDGVGQKVDTRITGFKNMSEASAARQSKT